MEVENYKFRFIVKMVNGKSYELITRMYLSEDVIKYIDGLKYISLFDRKQKEMVTVKSNYVVSVMFKDSKEDEEPKMVKWEEL